MSSDAEHSMENDGKHQCASEKKRLEQMQRQRIDGEKSYNVLTWFFSGDARGMDRDSTIIRLGMFGRVYGSTETLFLERRRRIVKHIGIKSK